MARILNFGTTPVDPGETLVLNYLAEKLPDSFLLIPNIELVDRLSGQRGQPFEYDLVIIAPHAIYAAEVKRWLGRIEGDNYDWVLNGRGRRPNPLRLANYKSRVLKNALLRESPAFKSVWVEGCVFIADDRASLNLSRDCAERVFKYTDAPAFLLNTNEIKQSPGNILGLIDDIVRALRGGSKPRSPQPLDFGSYRITETLGSNDLVTEYLARHKHLPGDSQIYRLRVFNLSPHLPTDELRRRRETITRDFQALQAIGDHPNLLRVRDFFEHNSHAYVEVTEWSNEGTLRKLMSGRSAPLTVERKFDILLGLARGLAAAHVRNVLHRDIRPENILIAWDGTPRLINFDRARIAREGYETVWDDATTDLDRTYLSPELAQANPQPSPTSDLYSLGLVTCELFTGRLPYTSLDDFKNLGGRLDTAPESLPGIPDGLIEILSRLVVVDPTARYASAETLIADVQKILTRASASNVSQTTGIKDRYEEKDMIGGVYRVLKKLGEGGLAHVYHVYHLIQDREFALKIMNTDVNLERLQSEFKAMSSLNHPYVARAIWADRIHGGQYFLATEYIEGETLKPYAEHKKRLSIPEIIRLGNQLLEALDHMHPNLELARQLREQYGADLTEKQFNEIEQAKQGVFHRDIKPANLMLTRDGIKIIDFNIAAWAQSVPTGFMGTPSYVAPDWNMEGGYEASCDLFSVGIVLYELVTGHHPYPDDLPSFEKAPINPRKYIPELSSAFVQFLFKSIASHRQNRFPSAKEMLTALNSITDLIDQPTALIARRDIQVQIRQDEVSRPNYNPYLTRLLALYSQARSDNSGTRGLDDIALATYIPTRLDTALEPAILSGNHRLILITGNAGDGKTAFIQQLESEAKRRGAMLTPTNSSGNGHRFSLNNFDFVTNYDGSQDESGRANDDVLLEFFAPFSGNAPLSQNTKYVHVIAINEGRLRDFIAAHKLEYPALNKILLDYFDSEIPAVPPVGILIINLNWRSVVAGGENSIFVQQVKSMLEDYFWEPCNTCEFKNQCATKFNVDSLREPISGAQVQERLRTLFETVALRRQLHITMRDMRSALSYLLFRDRTCNEIIAFLQSNKDPLEDLSFIYYNGLGSLVRLRIPNDDASNQAGPANIQHGDRLIDLLQQVDIALVANPTDDRELYFEGATGVLLADFSKRSVHESQLIESARDSLPVGWAVAQDSSIRERHQVLHAILRRKAFFERRDNWRRMLPFNELLLFQQATQSSNMEERTGALESLRRLILVGLSALEGCRDINLTARYVCLRAGSINKPSIKSFRLFSSDDFYLVVPQVAEQYLEFIPDSILLRHRIAQGSLAYDAEMRVTIDILELFAQVERGFVPSVDDIRGKYVNLIVFRNALAHLRYREVLLMDSDGSLYKADVDAQNVITLQKA